MSRKAEISGQCAEFGRALDPALNVDPFDGIAFFNVVNILEEVQVQLELAAWRKQKREPFASFLCLGVREISFKRIKYFKDSSHIQKDDYGCGLPRALVVFQQLPAFINEKGSRHTVYYSSERTDNPF
ncbi:hypothetical protein EYF80_054588 [Liparis tanakae]|uniref:Uncharacterized protein n=1 Tax=Liparis tanakae TaxID=230148 RepID=A0A4Z2F2Z0_9TELE|nr:hypothetical protein EYF80_054588 [Liparis tanakae]